MSVNETISIFTNIFKTEKFTLLPKISPKQGRPPSKNRKKRSPKTGYYFSKILNEWIWCDSSWETAWIIFQEDHNIPFQRNYDKFPYQYKNRTHHYIPDFKLPTGVYIEIKGREYEQTPYKYTAIPQEKLTIIRKKEMKPYLDYVINKYGTEYWKCLKDKIE
jgi:hypothetical protein